MRKFAIIYDLTNREWYGYEKKENETITESYFDFKDIKDLEEKLKKDGLEGYVFYEEETKRIEGFGWFED